MRTIFVDSNFKCHVANDGTMTAVETDYFDGKCDAYIEGYCHKDDQFYPWIDSSVQEAAQQDYDNARVADLEEFARIILGGDSV